MNAAEEITNRILSWPETTKAPHRFGGTEFSFRTEEIGHLHGSSLIDMCFPLRMRKELLRLGKASPHHMYPNSGWVSYWIHGEEDLEGAIELLRMKYDWLAVKYAGKS